MDPAITEAVVTPDVRSVRTSPDGTLRTITLRVPKTGALAEFTLRVPQRLWTLASVTDGSGVEEPNTTLGKRLSGRLARVYAVHVLGFDPSYGFARQGRPNPATARELACHSAATPPVAFYASSLTTPPN